MGRIVLFAFTAAFNPTLLAATTVMLVLPNPQRLLVGYLLGALLTSMTLGLVIESALEGTSLAHTTQSTLSPAADLVLAALALGLAYALAGGYDARMRERRKGGDRPAKGPPRWQRALSGGSPRVTFLLGVALSLPGASYLAGLRRLSSLHLSPVLTVVTVLGFNAVMLALIEVPLLCFALAPERTPGAIDGGKAWLGDNWRRLATRGMVIVAVALIIKGVAGLLA